MSNSRLSQTMANMKQELARIENSCRDIGSRHEILQREAEALKLDILKYSLEKQVKSWESQRGFNLLVRDKKRVVTTLAVAAGSSILGGLISRDGYTALNAGLSGLDGVLQSFGGTKWAVSFRKEPCSTIRGDYGGSEMGYI